MKLEEALGIKQPVVEETLQSIDSTLKRIENLLLNQTRPVSIDISNGNTNDLVLCHDGKKK